MNSPSTPNDWPEKAVPQEFVKQLFDRMLSKWGKQYVDKWAVVEYDVLEKEWGKALYGLTTLELRRGVSKLNTFDRPPSQPEFLKACRPEVNPLSAYYEALEGARSRERGEVGTWSHPAIFWAAVRVSTFELKNSSYSQIRGRWEAALAAELAKNQWDEIPEPMMALPAPGKDRISREGAKKMLHELKSRTSAAPKGAQGDGKDWARRLLERERNGEQLLPIQREFARQALRTTFEEEDHG